MTIAYVVTTPIPQPPFRSAHFCTPSIERAFAELIAAPGRGRRMRVLVDDEIPAQVRENIEHARD